jgi:hypothetical protein
VKILIILLFLTSVKTFGQLTPQEIGLVHKYNFKQYINNKPPIKIDPHLTRIANKIAKNLQTKKIDTLIPNTIILYNTDSIPQNLEPIVGISIRPHQYHCTILVITQNKLPKFREDLTCRPYKKKSLFGSKK